MAEENLEIVRRAIAELGGDSFEFWDPEVEIVNAADWVIETDYHGHEGVKRWWIDLAEAFGEFSMELVDVIELDSGRVLTTQRLKGRFRTTEIPMDGEWASILDIRHGRVVRAQGYLSKRRALRAAGL
jgi:ketosteroid isomerase-like protein